MNKKSLSNSKMGKIVARLFDKESLDVVDGKVSLSEDERKTVLSEYGQAFLEKLESITLNDGDDSAVDLFNEVVSAKASEATAALTKQIKEQAAQISKLQKDIVTLSDAPEDSPEPQASDGKPSLNFAIDMSARHNKIAEKALVDAPTTYFTEDPINVADLNKEFTGLMPPNVKLELLAKRIYNGFVDSKYMTRVQSNTDYIASAAIMSEVSQQFTPKWTPKGIAKFTPCKIPYRRHKINVLIQPAEVIKSWLLYLYEQGTKLSDMPITRYIIEEHILPKVLDDITFSMIGKGKFVDVGTTVDGQYGPAAVNSMNGYETILVEGKADATCKINYYKSAQNPLTLADQALLDYVNGFVDSISGMWARKVTVFCSEQLMTKYKRADFAINGKYTGMEAGNTIRFTSFNLVCLESMYNSPIIFATPQTNFVELVDYSKAEACINKIEEQNYDVKVFGEYSLSVGFKIEEAVFASVPDGYTPSTSVITDGFDTSKWQNGTASEGA